jgi:hypothetical protein
VVWRDLRGHVSGMWLRVLEEPGRGDELGKLTFVDGTMWNSSILVLVYAYAMFQKRLTMIGTRDAGQFGACTNLYHIIPSFNAPY